MVKTDCCPICHYDRLSCIGKIDSRTISLCKFCTHRFASEYAPEFVEQAYTKNYYSSPDDPRIDQWIGQNREIWQGLCSDIKKYSGTCANILDVGAGTGGFLLEFLQQYPETEIYAVEQSGHACNSVQNKTDRITFIADDAQSLNKINRNFELITFFQVLEHLADPVSALSAAFEKMNNGGYLFLTVPNSRSYLAWFKGLQDGYCFTNPTHLHFFTLKSICLALSKAGFPKIQRITDYGGSGLGILKSGLQYLFRKAGISTELRFFAQKSVV